MKDVRLGYSYWGFLGDYKLDANRKELSTPDGNAAYSWSILWEAQQRGWDTYLMQRDRDAVGYDLLTDRLFSAFSSAKRTEAFLGAMPFGGSGDFPELDVLLLEWRFPIPGRNTGVDKKDPNYQPDLDRQLALLNHYKDKTKTKIIIWDLDHKLTLDEEFQWQPDAIFETSARPLQQYIKRTRVEPPICVDDLMQHDTLPVNPLRKMVYIGSRYERDDVIQKYLAPCARFIPDQIEFWGNWTNEPNYSQCLKMWPQFKYNSRIAMRDFRKVYGNAVCVPLLAKQSYIESGFITPRPWEALLFGSIPVGISSMTGINDYVLFSACDAKEFLDISEELSERDRNGRHQLRQLNVEKLRFMDVSNFIDRIEEVLDGKNSRKLVKTPART